MRSGIILAIIVSLILVGGASWSRLSSSKSVPNLIAVEQNRAADAAQLQEVLVNYQNPTSTPVSVEPLTGTDLIGRQLILDYIGLAQSGEATEENLSILAERYVESIPTLIIARKISYTDLNIVPNSRASLINYAAAIEKIYLNYSSKLMGAYSEESTQMAAASSKMSYIYSETADKLTRLIVPSELAEAHLLLINTYLGNSAAMEAVAKMEADPASAFAGLIALKSSSEKEQEALSEIEEILKDNGV